jgi:hypothetical protein
MLRGPGELGPCDTVDIGGLGPGTLEAGPGTLKAGPRGPSSLILGKQVPGSVGA